MGLLDKPIWNYKDIKKYLGVGTTKAYKIMSICRKKYGGTIIEEPSYVARDSVLAYCHTTLAREKGGKNILYGEIL